MISMNCRLQRLILLIDVHLRILTNDFYHRNVEKNHGVKISVESQQLISSNRVFGEKNQLVEVLCLLQNLKTYSEVLFFPFCCLCLMNFILIDRLASITLTIRF